MAGLPVDTETRFPQWCDTPQRRQIFGLTEYDWPRMTWVHVPTKLSNWRRKELVLEVERAITVAQTLNKEDAARKERNGRQPYDLPKGKLIKPAVCEGVQESILQAYGKPDPYLKAHEERPEQTPVDREFRGRAIAENLCAAIAHDHPEVLSMKARHAEERDLVNLPKHYAMWEIEPIRFLTENNIGWCEGNAIKYLMRWRHKNGREDLMKVLSYANLIIAREDGDREWWTINRRNPITFKERQT